jgi:cytochrome c6
MLYIEVGRKILKWLSILLTFLALAAFGVDRSLAADVFAGQAVYQAHCVNCHGIDGKPVVPGTPDFTRGTGLMAPDSILVPTMKAGKGLMPGFEHILSERDILNALAYSRTLQR